MAQQTTTTENKRCLTMERAAIVYQVGICNVFSLPTVGPLSDGERLLQSYYETCEAYARGLMDAGVGVEVWHCDYPGDIRLATDEWKPGQGTLWSESKRPHSAWRYVDYEEED